MKNFEAYEDKIKELNYDFAVKNGEVIKCYGSCNSCDFRPNNSGNCKYNKIKWLYEKYKIKIPLATKVILENLNEKYKWIAKDANGKVWAYENRPKKEIDINKWSNVDSGYMCGFAKVFKEGVFDFLSWGDEKPTNIEELLKDCEMIENE